MLDSLSIVVPAYNEAERLPASLEAMCAWADRSGMDVEIIVADDGSSDDTAALVRRFADADARVKLERLERNRGKGGAVKAGVARAVGRWILITDADLSTPIEEVERLAAAAVARAVPIAIGSRDVAESRIEIHQPWYREAMGRTFNRIVQAVAVPGIADTQCGFKLLRADVAKELFARLTVDGFAFDVELLMLASRLGHAIVEVGVRWRNDDRSRVHPIRDSARMFVDVVRLRLRHRGLRP
jgi:dolichyl-phosphate beta-glucosyltransferase